MEIHGDILDSELQRLSSIVLASPNLDAFKNLLQLALADVSDDNLIWEEVVALVKYFHLSPARVGTR